MERREQGEYDFNGSLMEAALEGQHFFLFRHYFLICFLLFLLSLRSIFAWILSHGAAKR